MRPRDRLPELRRIALEAGDAEGAVPPPGPGDCGRYGDEIDAIYEEAEQVRSWTEELERNTRLMRSLLTDPTFHTSRALQEQLDGVATRSNALALKVCGLLRQLEARAQEAAREGGEGPAARIARLQASCLRRRFADRLADHHALLAAHRDHHERLLRQQIQLLRGEAEEEECRRLLEEAGEGDGGVALFVDNLRVETAQALGQLRAAEARRDELRRVEGSLAEVRDLFAQLAHLVAMQQEQVDTVEQFASQAGRQVDQGERQLHSAGQKRRGRSQKKLSVALCLAGGLALVLLVLVLT